MIFYRVEITSETASFRHPTIITAYQPTLPVPPVSTIMGLLSCVTGKYIIPKDYSFGYIFHSTTKFIDLETTYKTDGKLNNKGEMEVTSDIIKREMFFKTKLFLYLQDKELAFKFKTPFYPLLLGRSSDLATTMSVKELDLEKESQCCLYGTSIEFSNKTSLLPGQLQALPTYYDESFPRKAKDVKPYLLIDKPAITNELYYCDPELTTLIGINKNIGIYFHE